MNRQLPLTPTEAEKFKALAVGESMWIARAGYDTQRPPARKVNHPPAEFVQACAPCPRSDKTSPDLHRLFAPGGICLECRIELVGPCPTCHGDPYPCWKCRNTQCVTLGYAYAVANATTGRCEPLPIVEMAGSAGMGERVYGTAADPWHWRDDSDTGQTKITAALAHYGPPESLVGQWAIEVRKA